jgi:ribosomal protein S12 methylthiotransferase
MLNKQFEQFCWRGKRVGIVTLGCVRNTVDSEKILADVKCRGAVICAPGEASTIILNTCGFTEEAKAESLKAISDLAFLKRAGKIREIIVRGCLSQRYHKELSESYKDIDIFAGLVDFKNTFDSTARLTPAHIAHVKIAEGCANSCSFCAIPLIKGALRSRPVEDIIREARFWDKEGVRELNIVGQDITLYGFENAVRSKTALPLVKLLKKIIKNTTIPWIRLLYLHPRRVTDDLIDLMAQDARLCPYVDLPLQHTSDRILRLMNRGIGQKEIIALIEKIRKKIKGVALRTTLIVGFPSETKKEFREMCAFVERMRFDRLGVFAYSREEGTRAYDFRQQISQKVKRERVDTLMAVQARVSESNLRRRVGTIEDVLIESTAGRSFIYTGRTRRDAPEVDGVFLLKSSCRLKAGDVVSCRVTGSTLHDLKGVVHR